MCTHSFSIARLNPNIKIIRSFNLQYNSMSLAGANQAEPSSTNTNILSKKAVYLRTQIVYKAIELLVKHSIKHLFVVFFIKLNEYFKVLQVGLRLSDMLWLYPGSKMIKFNNEHSINLNFCLSNYRIDITFKMSVLSTSKKPSALSFIDWWSKRYENWWIWRRNIL